MNHRLLIAVFVVVLASRTASATTWVVSPDGAGDAPTIQAAIDSTVAGDIVELTDGVFVGPGNRDLNYLGKSITIRSQSGDPTSCTINCQFAARGITFASGEDSTSVLEGVTIAYGYLPVNGDGGGIYCRDSAPRIRSCIIRDCTVSQQGGGLFAEGPATPLVADCQFIDNVSFGFGGGLFLYGASQARIESSSFVSNLAQNGAGVYFGNNFDVVVIGCTFLGNEADNNGGGCWAWGNVLFQDSSFFENVANGGSGGGLYIDNAVTIVGGVFAANQSVSGQARGAACFLDTGPLLISGATMIGNIGVLGSAVCTSSSPEEVQVESCTIVANEGTESAVYLAGELGTLRQSIIAFTIAGKAIEGVANLNCCDLFGNDGGDWTGQISNQLGFGGNISEDPLFCDLGGSDLRLAEDSPCAPFTPPNAPCDLIGAWPAGCGASCSLAAMTPAGGEEFCEGDTVSITWDYADSCSGTVSIDLLLDGTPCATIAEATPNDGIFEWVASWCGLEGGYSIRVSDAEGWRSAESPGTFAIGDLVPPTVSVPNGGEVFAVSEEVPIEWETQACSGPTVTIELLRSGAVCDTVAASTENDGFLRWPAAQCGLETEDYTLRITDLELGLSDESNGAFQIVPSCAITVLSPNGGEDFLVGDAVQIEWTSIDSCGESVEIALLQDGLVCDVISDSTGNDGSFSWVAGQCGNNGAYTVRVADLTTGATDESNGSFTITPVYGIESIADVGNDQGRQVRLTWLGHWTDGGSDPATSEYEIYRRQDEFIQPPDESASPDGSEETRLACWDFIAAIPAHGDSVYHYVAPTLCDSTVAEGTCWSVFFVRAATADPVVYFDTSPDSGYSVDNLAPGAPENLRWDQGVASLLVWDESADGDFDYFSVYGSIDPEYGESAILVANTIVPELDVTAESYEYYFVTATDFAGNEGDPASLQSPSNTPDWPGQPTQVALHPPRPNPTEGTVTLVLGIPSAAQVDLGVYDVAGRRLATIHSGRLSAGFHPILWDPKHAEGVSTGVYFIRLVVEGEEHVRRLVVAR